ncbi:hypothetical protein H8D36_01135 [archaeon]|nr:hypothetical protein [archaeon]
MSESTQPTFDAERAHNFISEVVTFAFDYSQIEKTIRQTATDKADINFVANLGGIFDPKAASTLAHPFTMCNTTNAAIDKEYKIVSDILKVFLTQNESMLTSNGATLDDNVAEIIGENLIGGLGNTRSSAGFLVTLNDAIATYDLDVPTVDREVNFTSLYEAVNAVYDRIQEFGGIDAVNKVMTKKGLVPITDGSEILEQYLEFARGEGDQVYLMQENIGIVVQAAYLFAPDREELSLLVEDEPETPVTDNDSSTSFRDRFRISNLKSYLSNLQMPNLSEHIPDRFSISNLKSYLSNLQMPDVRGHIPDWLSISNLKSYLSRNRTSEPVPTLDTVTEQVYQAEPEEPIVEPMPVVTEVTQTPRTPIDDYITRTATMGPEPTPEISPEDASFFAMADQYAAQETMESEVPFDYNPGPQIIGPVPTPEPIPEPIQQPTPINPDNTPVTDEDFVIEPVAIQLASQVKLPYKNKAWRMYSRRTGNFGTVSQRHFNFLYKREPAYMREFLDKPGNRLGKIKNTFGYMKNKWVA